MPTGYTCKITEGQSFEDFVLGCARAFGACIDMREDPMDAPIPDEFKPSDYHERELVEAEARLAKLLALGEIERADLGISLREQAVKQAQTDLDKSAAENAQYLAMLEKVKAWEPPTPEHIHMQEFMVQQISVSLNDSLYSEERLHIAKETPSAQYATEEIERAAQRVKYHAGHQLAEVERTARHNAWIKALRASLRGKA